MRTSTSRVQLATGSSSYLLQCLFGVQVETIAPMFFYLDLARPLWIVQKRGNSAVRPRGVGLQDSW